MLNTGMLSTMPYSITNCFCIVSMWISKSKLWISVIPYSRFFSVFAPSGGGQICVSTFIHQFHLYRWWLLLHHDHYVKLTFPCWSLIVSIMLDVIRISPLVFSSIFDVLCDINQWSAIYITPKHMHEGNKSLSSCMTNIHLTKDNPI